ncbi:MAG: S-layer homology domain-containing protein [Candidatus Gracilibacteria bacterium]
MKTKKYEFSLKRVMLGVLIGILSVSSLFGVGRAMQANVFNNLFAWLASEENCYYDDAGVYTCDGSYDADDGTDDSTQGCGVCDGRCVQVGETYTCEDTDDYSGDDYGDNSDYDDSGDDGDDSDWQQDSEQSEEDLENMAEMLEEAADWSEDISDAKEEAEEWMEDLLDRAERWQEDLENMEEWAEEDDTIVVSSIYEEAIAYTETASDAIEELLPEFDALLTSAEDSKATMEEAYENYVNAGTGDSSEFWDAQGVSGVNDWRDIYRTKAEMWGRLANFYDFLIESTRIEAETGMTVEEIGGEFEAAVATAEEAISTIKSALESGGELDSMIETAEAEIAAGEDTWRAIDDVRDYTDDLRDLMDEEKDMWDSMEDAWDLVKEKEMDNFRDEELAMIREDIAWISEELDALEAEGKDVEKAKVLLEEAEDLLDKLEVAEDGEEMEDLFKELDEVGKKAEKEFSKLGIDFGQYDKDAYVNSIDVNDPDALLELLSNIPQNVLEQVIAMLLANVNSTQLEDFMTYSEQFGDVGFFDNASIAYMDEETLNTMIEDKMAVLAELDSKIASLMGDIASLESELRSMTEKIAGYNFYGDSVDEIVALQGEIYTVVDGLNSKGASDEEMKDVLADYDDEIEDLKTDAREEKYTDGLIPFMDTDDDQWFMSYVMDVKEEGIIGGYKDDQGNLTGYFGPSDNVTVGEILKMSLESAGEDKGTGTSYNPYAQDHWSAGYFDKAEDLGMALAEDITQDPNDYATRGEVIQSLFEAMGVTIPEDVDTSFKDVTENYEYYDAVAYAQELGVINGDNGEGEIFRPDDSVNRAEAAKMIDAFLESMELEGVIE